MGGGGGRTTSTTTPTPTDVPQQLVPLVNAAIANMTGTMPYVPLQMFAQPNPQVIPNLTPQQIALINETMSLPYNPALLAPTQGAMGMTLGALGYGNQGGLYSAFNTPAPYNLGPQFPTPSPYRVQTGPSPYPVMPRWGPPPAVMGWTTDANGNPIWGPVDQAPGWTPPPAPVAAAVPDASPTTSSQPGSEPWINPSPGGSA